MSEPQMRAVRAGMRTEYWHPDGIRVVFDYLNPTTKGLEAWCEIRWQGNVPDPRPLTFGRYDLMGATTVSRLAQQAALDCPRLGQDTPAELRSMIGFAVYDMIETHNQGKETVVLADVEPAHSQWLLRPLMEGGTNTRIIARGGSTKSFLALAIAATITTGRSRLLGLKPSVVGPVLYLDWEADNGTQAARLRAMCKGAGLDLPDSLIYEHHDAPLAKAVHGIARSVAEYEPVALVVDSNAMARGGGGQGSAEDTTQAMFAALRHLGRPALIVDHKSDEKIRKGQKGGYGSIFNQNLARLEWEYARIHTMGDVTSFVLSLEKANNIRTGLELAYEFTFENVGEGDERHLDSVQIRQVAPSSVSGIAAWDQAEKLRDKIFAYLSSEGDVCSVAEISVGLSVSEGTVRKELHRHSDFVNVALTGTGKWTTKEVADAIQPIPF